MRDGFEPEEALRDIELLPKQAEFWKYDGRIAAIRGGVRSGKTLVVCLYLLSRMMRYPKGQHYVVGGVFKQLRGFRLTFSGLCDRLGIKYRQGAAVDSPFRLLRSGAEWSPLSAELRESVRSLECDTLIFEEPQTWLNGNGEEFFHTMFERLWKSPPAVAYYPEMQTQLRMTFNPPKVGTWLHELFTNPEKWSKFPCWQFSLLDNYLGPGQSEYIDGLRSTIDKERWPSEIEGDWASMSTGPYSRFDYRIHAVEPGGKPNPELIWRMAVDTTKPICWSLDFNVQHMASVVCQVHDQPLVVTGRHRKNPFEQWQQTVGPGVPEWQRQIVYVLDEIFLTDSNASVPQAVDEFAKRYGDLARKTGIMLYGDPAGGGRSGMIDGRSAIRTQWAQAIERLGQHGIKIHGANFRVARADPGTQNRINFVQEAFRTGSGRRDAAGLIVLDESGSAMPAYGLAVSTACKELITDFMSCEWVPGKNELRKPTEGPGAKRTHTSDALAYLVAQIRREARGERFNMLDWKSR